MTELRGAIRLQPDHAAAHFSFGVALFRQARVDLALDEFRETIRLQPDHAAAHSEVGAILCDFKQDYDAAIAEFREAIRLKPDDPIAHYGLGNVFSHRDNPEDALVEYREVLRLKPGNAEVHEAIDRTLARLAQEIEREHHPEHARLDLDLAGVRDFPGLNELPEAAGPIACLLGPTERSPGKVASSIAPGENGARRSSAITRPSCPLL